MNRPVLLLSMSLLGACGDAPRTGIPRIEVGRASAIVIDGRFDEEAWSHAARTERFVDTMDGSQASPKASARIAWGEARLYFAFEVEDEELVSTMRDRDAHLWEEDVVEIMVDPDGDERDYVELQVSPANVVFDTRFASRRAPAPFGRLDYTSGLESAVVFHGRLDDGQSDDGYDVEIGIPWSAFGDGTAPSAGDEWRVALYVLDKRANGQLGVGWSAPLVGDFHELSRFGRVVFTR
jgi:hypothetical protein